MVTAHRSASDRLPKLPGVSSGVSCSIQNSLKYRIASSMKVYTTMRRLYASVFFFHARPFWANPFRVERLPKYE